MRAKAYLLFCVALSSLTTVWSFTSQDVKCHVCKATVQEMEEAIAKQDPNKLADVSGFRLDAAGNSISKTVKLVKSEMFLTELMENICSKMEDYVRVTYKQSGKLALLKMIVNGKMNSESSKVDFVQDGDLNKSLEHYCLEILEDQEEAFLKAFQANSLDDNLDIRICSEQTNYCKDAPIQDDYEFDKEEL